MHRLQSIDFLRGVAIILVLFHHHWIGVDWLQNFSWCGVDLFFVLSGFLVSGLLFGEQKKYGDVQRGRFLIRRGFKIYPMFYLSLALTVILGLTVGWNDPLNWKGRLIAFFGEVFFVQAYVPGGWPHHWSLSVEEHFYLLLAAVFPLIRTRVPKIAPVLFVGCLILRLIYPVPTWSHLRMDSLFMGVLVAYYYHHGDLEGFYKRYWPIMVALCFIPFLFAFGPLDYFTMTIGFSLLYISFASLLILFLYTPLRLPAFVSQIGYYSYGIYLFHYYPLRFLLGYQYREFLPHTFGLDTMPSFLIYLAISLVMGVGISMLVEKPMLKLRDKWFPRRSEAIQ
jgi:peptidoglycan/LPS O-acetylase OafA/YrhL